MEILNNKNMKQDILLLAYRKYKAWDVENYKNYCDENPGVWVDWQPYSLEEFKSKAFDIDDEEFLKRFDNWYDDAKREILRK